MKRSRRTVEIDMAELRRALYRARQEPIGEADYLKLKVALDVLDERLKPTRTSALSETDPPLLSKNDPGGRQQIYSRKRRAASEIARSRSSSLLIALTTSNHSSFTVSG